MLAVLGSLSLGTQGLSHLSLLALAPAHCGSRCPHTRTPQACQNQMTGEAAPAVGERGCGSAELARGHWFNFGPLVSGQRCVGRWATRPCHPPHRVKGSGNVAQLCFVTESSGTMADTGFMVTRITSYGVVA